ncbi:MAG TPA: dual specificity protein phosphatase [Candidatus Limnocylindrales bacterium]
MRRSSGALEPDISKITDYLYISAFPEAEHAATIRALNVRLILSMPLQKPHHEVRMPPVRWLHLRTVDSPLVPMPVSVLRRGVEAALPVIDDGDAVLVHCLAGVHRSVAMACCVLIGMGYSAEEAMQLVESKREVADPRVWYIRARIEKFERSWRARHPGGRLAAGG